MKKVLVEVTYDEEYLAKNDTDIHTELNWMNLVDSAQIVEDETVWRIQEDDIRCVIADCFPQITKEEDIAEVIDCAKRLFSIDDWSDYVRTFIDIRCDHILDKYQTSTEEK